MTLTEFLLARIAEDEAFAREAMIMPERVHPHADEVVQSSRPFRGPGHWGWDGSDHVHASEMWDYDEPIGYRMDIATTPPDLDVARHIARWDPARVLAECEAKRRILQEWQRSEDENRRAYGVNPAPSIIARALALPYADHPDFDSAWRIS